MNGNCNNSYIDYLHKYVLLISAGLGQELWRSSCVSILYPGVCDLVIAVNCANAAEDSFARLRSYVGDVNPTLPVLKALPGQLRLDNDFVEQVLSFILPSDRSIRSGKLTDRLSMGYPSEFLLKQSPRKASLPYSGIYGGSSSLAYSRLSTVRISAHELQMHWDSSSVVAVLQLLFPVAKTSFNNSNTLFGERWHAPPKSNRNAKEAGYFARTKQLAIAKVDALEEKFAMNVDNNSFSSLGHGGEAVYGWSTKFPQAITRARANRTEASRIV